MRPLYVRVYFSAWPERRRRLRSLWRIRGRSPKVVHAAILSALLRLFSREFGHVFVSSRGAVLDPSVLYGDRFWPEIPFVTHHPMIAWVFDVPVPTLPDLDKYSSSRSKTPVRAFLRWVTGGWVTSRDCVSSTLAVLRACGITVPRRVITPDDLWDFLRSEGYDCRSL